MKDGKDEVHDGRPQVDPSERTTRGGQDVELALYERCWGKRTNPMNWR